MTNLTLKKDTITSAVKTETVGAEKGKLLPQEIGLIVTDYLVENFGEILSYGFTANVEKDFDEIAEGEKAWNSVISSFYTPFHKQVDAVLSNREYSHVSREIGTDPVSGKKIIAKFGQYGPYVQKGEGEDRQFANLGKGQLIETLTLEDALKLFELPRKVGEIDGVDVVAMRGRFGPYFKHGDKNYSLPKGVDPLTVTLDKCREIIGKEAAAGGTNTVLREFSDSGIQIISGRYGPYIKQGKENYRIPKGKDAEKLTEKDCLDIISSTGPTGKKKKFLRK